MEAEKRALLTDIMIIVIARLLVPTGIGILICYALIRITHSRFREILNIDPSPPETPDESAPPRWVQRVRLFLLFFFLPMVFLSAGTGIIASPNPSFQDALRQFPDIEAATRGDLQWLDAYQAAVLVFAFLGVALVRLYSRIYTDIIESAYVLTISCLLIYVVCGFLQPVYLEVVFESLITADFLLPYAALAVSGTVLTEIAAKTVDG